MKMAAAEALAHLAREEVPQEVLKAYDLESLTFGKDYIIPTPFDPRLIHVISMAVARAAMESKVARKPIENWEEYEKQLKERTHQIV